MNPKKNKKTKKKLISNQADMNRILKKNIRRTIVFIFTFCAVFIFAIIYNTVLPKKYSLTEDSVSPYDIVATRDSRNREKAEDAAQKAVDELVPSYIKNNEKYNESWDLLDIFFELTDTYMQKPQRNLSELGIEPSNKEYGAKLEEQKAAETEELLKKFKEAGLTFSAEDCKKIFEIKNNTDYSTFKREIKNIVNEKMLSDIMAENVVKTKEDAKNTFSNIIGTQPFTDLGNKLIDQVITVNRELDEEATNRRKEEKYNEVYYTTLEKGTIRRGERVINKGETVTAEKLNRLAELNLLETDNKIDLKLLFGTLFVAAFTALLLWYLLFELSKKKDIPLNEYLLICIVVVFTLLLSVILYRYNPLLTPVLLAPMLIGALLGTKKALAVNFSLLFTVLIFTNTIDVVAMIIISGSAACYFASKIKRRNSLPILGLITGGINVLLILSVGMITQEGTSNLLINSIYIFANALICTVLTIGLLPFIENIFNILTPIKLLELSNPNHPLLKRLLMEAPGTYHHSLMVSNIAEVAALAIRANETVTRVGAIFHDVGKLNRPTMFKENQTGGNPHDNMSPDLSVMVITSHTTDGHELALEYRLPEKIRDIILQHHGNTLVAYFYYKALKEDTVPGEENSLKGAYGEFSGKISEKSFRYKNNKPQTKEAAVVMLADATEAAVRSLPEKTEDKIEETILKVAKDKLDDGQFDECDITIKDINKCTKAFMTVLTGMYHTREIYPEFVKKRSGLQENEGSGKNDSSFSARIPQEEKGVEKSKLNEEVDEKRNMEEEQLNEE